MSRFPFEYNIEKIQLISAQELIRFPMCMYPSVDACTYKGYFMLSDWLSYFIYTWATSDERVNFVLHILYHILPWTTSSRRLFYNLSKSLKYFVVWVVMRGASHAATSLLHCALLSLKFIKKYFSCTPSKQNFLLHWKTLMKFSYLGTTIIFNF